MKRIVVGIDPSSNSAGFAAIDIDARELLHAETIVANSKAAPRERIRFIADAIGLLLESIDPDADVCVFSENTVMRGAGGATFQRCIGAIQSRVPMRMTFMDIQNTTVKKLVGGHGKADKVEVAYGARSWLSQQHQLDHLITTGQFDVTDAVAIGIAGLLKHAPMGRERSERGV